MAEQNENAENVPPTLAAPEPHETSAITAGRETIKPLYSKRHREEITSNCILRALRRKLKDERRQVQHEDDGEAWNWTLPLKTKWNLTKIPLVYQVHLQRATRTLFATLRERHFGISEDVYNQVLSRPLRPLSNLGLSGSAFFHTSQDDNSPSNAGLFIKSINRAFEYEFMHEKLLPAYLAHFNEHPGADSILTRITDVIWSTDASIGTLLAVSPRHYMAMVDILGDLKGVEGAKKWDLKPSGFFEPTRDLVPEAIKSDATKSGLADELDADVRIRLKKPQYDALMRIAERDTAFLEDLEIVDYSLLLGRYPANSNPEPPIGFEKHVKLLPSVNTSKLKAMVEPVLKGEAHVTGGDFISGVPSADGEWIYRMTIVDFMWNVKKLVPTVMRTAGKLLPDQTITTEPARYKKEFLEMIEGYVDIVL